MRRGVLLLALVPLLPPPPPPPLAAQDGAAFTLDGSRALGIRFERC